MKKILPHFYLLLTLLVTQIYSQALKISINNSPSTIVQENPKIWQLNDKYLLVTWEDYRKGNKAIYAQILNSHLQKMGKNFEIVGQDAVYPLIDTTFLSLKSTSFYYDYGFSYENVLKFSGRIYQGSTAISQTRNYYGFSFGVCGMEFHPMEVTVFPFNNYYLLLYLDSYFRGFYFNSLGETVRYFFNDDPALSADDRDYGLYHMTVVEFGDTFILIKMPLMSSVDSIYTLQADVFNEQDSIIANTIIDQLQTAALGDLYWTIVNSKLTSYMVNDSTALVGLWWSYPGKLFVYKIDKWGNVLSKTTFSHVSTSYEALKQQSLTIQRGVNQNFVLHLALNDFENGNVHDYFYYFDQEGNFTNDSLLLTNFNNGLTLNDFLFYKANHLFLQPKIVEDDVYLILNEQFSAELRKEKINDENEGSNELAENIIIKDPNERLMIYKDEVGYWGRLVSNMLTAEDDEIPLLGSRGGFFPDHWFVNVWTAQHRYVGYQLYDEYLRPIKIDTVFKASGNKFHLHVDGIVISDSSFVVAYVYHNQLVLKLMKRSGEEIRSCSQSFKDYPSWFRLQTNDDQTFWCISENLAQKFDDRLQPISEPIKTTFNIQWINQDNKILTCDQYQPARGIIIQNKTVIADSIALFPVDANSHSIFKVNRDFFAVAYVRAKQLYSRLFDWQGNLINEALILNDTTLFNSCKNIKAQVDSNVAVFIWSSIPPAADYDVFAYQVPLNILTNVPQQSLVPRTSLILTNYPNPFNNQTVVKVYVPSQKRFSLTIYNLAGQKIKQLVQHGVGRGVERYVWDGKNEQGNPVASGVYICQLQTKEQIKSLKIILVH